MMNKILVTVRVPMIQQDYDVYIPASKNVKTTIDLLAKTVNELSGGYFPLDNDYTLMSQSGVVFDLRANIKESNIKNGDVIILL